MPRQQRSRRTWTRWRKLITQQAKSSESGAAFCQKRGLCARHFYSWKKRLNESEARCSPFVEVNVLPPKPAAVASAAIEILLNDDRRLLVESGFEAENLRAFVAMLMIGLSSLNSLD